jgi:hypothetical protein
MPSRIKYMLAAVEDQQGRGLPQVVHYRLEERTTRSAAQGLVHSGFDQAGSAKAANSAK